MFPTPNPRNGLILSPVRQVAILHTEEFADLAQSGERQTEVQTSVRVIWRACVRSTEFANYFSSRPLLQKRAIRFARLHHYRGAGDADVLVAFLPLCDGRPLLYSWSTRSDFIRRILGGTLG